MQIVNNELTKMEKQGLIEFKDAVRRQIKIEQPEPRKNADKILEVADILTKEEVENEVL